MTDEERFERLIDATNAVIYAWENAANTSAVIDEYQDDNDITFTDDERAEIFERARGATE